MFQSMTVTSLDPDEANARQIERAAEAAGYGVRGKISVEHAVGSNGVYQEVRPGKVFTVWLKSAFLDVDQGGTFRREASIRGTLEEVLRLLDRLDRAAVMKRAIEEAQAAGWRVGHDEGLRGATNAILREVGGLKEKMRQP